MSNLRYETVLDQALALSPDDRARLINQLAAQGRNLANGPSATATGINPEAMEYLTPQHPNVDWASPMEWLRINRERYRGQWVGLDGGRLVAHGPEASEVFAAVRAESIPLPFITFIPEAAKENGAQVFNFF
ncbi:MAG: DUF5678 domain-containing protein [Acidobacteria bacterium]|nr:DUF5678 domain-containing protein [Acidobacteriota bacterium]